MILSEIQILYVGLAALLVGFSKTSVGGVGILSVLLMALAIPGKGSPGVLLPMLIMADIFAVIFYRRQCQWWILLKLLPLTFVGVGMGYLLMGIIPAQIFGQIIGGLFLVILFTEIFVSEAVNHLVKGWFLTSVVGIIAGISTMIANAAGPVFMVYLLRMGLDKKEFVGTRSWYFLLLNVFKLPFSANLGLINSETIKLDFMFFPVILTGALLGYWFLGLINLGVFKWLVRIAALIVSIRLLFF